MALGCGAKFSKYIVFLFNVLFWITGLIFIIVGSIYLATGRFKAFEEIVLPNDRYFTRLMYGIVVLGCIVFIVGFCGCCGAIRESKLLLGMYIALLLLIMIAEISCGLYAIVKKMEVEEKIEKSLEKSIIKNYPPDNSTSNPNLKNAVDYIQETLKCCGVKSYKDWGKSVWYQTKKEPFMETPSSCCKSKIESELRICFNEQIYYRKGCSDGLRNFIKTKIPLIIGIIIGIAFIEILLVSFAFWLCRNTEIVHSSV